MYSVKRRFRLFRSVALSFLNPSLTLGSAVTIVDASPFVNGGRSYSFIESATSFISTPGGNDWQFGTGDFTVEWFSQNIGDSLGPIFGVGTDVRTSIALDGVNGSSGIYVSDNITRFNSFGVVASGVWYHIAIVRQNGVVRLFRNGTDYNNEGYSDPADINDTTSPFVVGNTTPFASNKAFIGYITNLRVVKGLAVYTDTFTRPTGPLTGTAGANPFGGSNTVAIPQGFTKLLLAP